MVDNTAPVITCPADITIECDESTDPANTGTATATDNCDGSPTITYSDVTGAGTITRTWTATDACGNSASCDQVITIEDTTPPAITCPADITVECDESTDPANTGSATATDNCDNNPTITYADTETSGACAQEKTITRTWTATDADNNSASCDQIITVVDDTAPVLSGCPADATVECDAIPAAATVTATDNCDPAPTVTLNETSSLTGCGGYTGTITRTWTATDACNNSSSCTQVLTVVDTQAPVVICPDDQTHHWAVGAQVVNATATDNCADPVDLAFSIADVNPPLVNGVSIDPATGEITYDPECDDIAGSPHVVTVEVSDPCDNVGTCTFNITVTNDLPTITCPADVPLWYSYSGMLDLPFTANDGTDPVTVSIFETLRNGLPDTPVQPMAIVGTYNFQWDPDWVDEGLWEITLEVDDGCQQTYCTFTINVLGKFYVCMDSTEVNPGGIATINLSVTNSMEVGGFDYVITYDPTIAFLEAEAVGDLLDWEYFTYRKSFQDNCGGGCPTGVLRLIGIADNPDGSTPPVSAFHPEGEIVKMTFQTPEDLNYVNQCFHLSWTWYDCGDNTMSSRTGDTLFVAQLFGDPETDPLPDDACLEGFKGITPMPRINFCDGEICIRPWPDDRGDINLNGIANEIADAVIYANYFIYGPNAWEYPDPTYYNRVQASDINDDGTPQTIADLVYLIGIITGEKPPYDPGYKITPFSDAAEITYEIDETMRVALHSPIDVGGAAFVFRHNGELGEPMLNVENMTLKSHDNGEELRVLVYSMDRHLIAQGSRGLFTVPLADGTDLELVEVQLSDAEGAPMTVTTHKNTAIPESFALKQNYPNPFNANTVITFALPEAADWNLTVYDIAGRVVRELTGNDEPGIVTVQWDGADERGETVASGIYFYRLTAATFSETKKMVLVK